jgi:hypothetical protein
MLFKQGKLHTTAKRLVITFIQQSKAVCLNA